MAESFTVFPAIDLRGGRCVRLKQGDFDLSKDYDADPVARAREWERQGAEAIHVVDLDGAKEGRPAQLDLVREMARAVSVPIQLGGGMRSLEHLLAARDAGAKFIVAGTAAVESRELRLRAVEELGDAFVVAIDARDGIVSTHGWQSSSGIPVPELARELASEDVSSVLFTDVGRDGMEEGAALEETGEVSRIIPVIASGGVGGAEDVAALSEVSGITGVIVGTALYEGRVSLAELLDAVGAGREKQ